MQAIWIYRNFFQRKHAASPAEISILCSQDFHYSMSKAADVLGINMVQIPVDEDDRTMTETSIRSALQQQKQLGVKYFIVVANMMTTMFGSVDDPEILVKALETEEVVFKLHVDGAYGGFIYPFTNPDNQLDFRNPHVNSVTLDAHKMVQAPYGTGIFLIRKNWMQYANTKDASYVEGEDFTLIGSRSGANAVAVWMILMTYGRFGWEEKMSILIKRTDWFCQQLNDLKIRYFRKAQSNIVTIRAQYVEHNVAVRYGLVPDNHHQPKWYKVVLMDHVTIEKLQPLVADLKID